MPAPAGCADRPAPPAWRVSSQDGLRPHRLAARQVRHAAPVPPRRRGRRDRPPLLRHERLRRRRSPRSACSSAATSAACTRPTRSSPLGPRRRRRHGRLGLLRLVPDRARRARPLAARARGVHAVEPRGLRHRRRLDLRHDRSSRWSTASRRSSPSLLDHDPVLLRAAGRASTRPTSSASSSPSSSCSLLGVFLGRVSRQRLCWRA